MAKSRGNKRQYVFILKRGGYSKVKIVFDKQTFLPEMLELEGRAPYVDFDGREHPIKVEIEFTKIDIGRRFPVELFSEASIVKIKNPDEVSLKNDYKSYLLVNNLNKIKYQ